MSETREEAVRALEGLRENLARSGVEAVYASHWSGAPTLVWPLSRGLNAKLTWRRGGIPYSMYGWQIWVVDPANGDLMGRHLTDTLADCLEWLEGQP